VRMCEPVLTPEQIAAAMLAAVLEREKLYAGVEDRRAIMRKVDGPRPCSHHHPMACLRTLAHTSCRPLWLEY
jgi:hypothetical protein